MAGKFDKRSFVIGKLRNSFKKTPMFSEVRNAAKEEYYVESKHGKQMRRVHFKCNSCGEFFKDKEIDVDHMDPVVNPDTGWIDYNDFIERLFCQADRLQVLCKPCHKAKTSKDIKTLAKTRRERKAKK